MLRESPDVVDLLVWACQNGLLGPRTQLACRSVDQRISAAALENLAQEILSFVTGIHRLEPPLADLLESPRPTRLLVIPNLGLAGEAVQQIGAVYSSTWGEAFYQRWTGPGALSRCAKEVLFPFIQTALELPGLDPGRLLLSEHHSITAPEVKRTPPTPPEFPASRLPRMIDLVIRPPEQDTVDERFPRQPVTMQLVSVPPTICTPAPCAPTFPFVMVTPERTACG